MEVVFRSVNGSSRRTVLAAAAGVALLAVVGGGLAIRGNGGTEPPDHRALPPGVLVGAHVQADGTSEQQRRVPLERLERELGRRFDIDHVFHPWDDPFPTDRQRWDLSRGRLPLISWNGRGVKASAIAAGSHNGLIAERAVRLKALKKPVLLRWFWEMDGNKKAEWAESPSDYVAAWKRMREVFREEGADNVEWVWCPNASAFTDGRASSYYPGADQVDWICADGYNWAPGRPGDEWRSFSDTFAGFYAWASTQGKPLMVGEFGVQERAESEKALWFRDAASTIRSEFPKLRAVVYFHARADYDWRIDTSRAALDAFRELAQDPWFSISETSRLTTP